MTPEAISPTQPGFNSTLHAKYLKIHASGTQSRMKAPLSRPLQLLTTTHYIRSSSMCILRWQWWVNNRAWQKTSKTFNPKRVCWHCPSGQFGTTISFDTARHGNLAQLSVLTLPIRAIWHNYRFTAEFMWSITQQGAGQDGKGWISTSPTFNVRFSFTRKQKKMKLNDNCIDRY